MSDLQPEDDWIPQRRTVEFASESAAPPLSNFEYLLMLSGGTPRAGTYRTEFHHADGRVLTETRIVDQDGRLIERAVEFKPLSPHR